ncbi:Aste57867_20158 [Aphanomyces stellatus]|uniref:Aste57867_20158 protein n=1 Tax=Aphanomyces stellatus TaxID=120398 RepID=A0A485LEC2_9STRA|nr:hypothetical protein As57867_020092 [Aphanomyces stellatus]VFT96853.1 Aste57867_20158 [Aphanomyces stellatus]
MFAVWSVQNNDVQFAMEDKELQDAVQGFQPQKSFRKDYLNYCKLLHVTPHPKLCPRLDEEDKDLLNQSYDDADVDVINVGNWMLDTASLRVMTLALQYAPSVHTVQLFNVSLSVAQLRFVCEKFPAISTLKTLQLEWNAITPPPDELDHTTCFASLLAPQASFTSLSLRANGITPAGTIAIAEMLKTNTKLIVLNLFSNLMQDEGATALSYALTENHTLLHLSVANNGITAQGCMALARGVTKYILRDDQLLHLADMEVQIQAALEAAKKQKKKLDRADVVKELNLPETDTVDGVVYGMGNATIQSLTMSGNGMATLDELVPLSKLLDDHQAKLKTHLHVVKAQRMFPRSVVGGAATMKQALSEFLLL